jgi:peptidoglycan-N-acetylglucosamine deacetylase
MWFFGIVFVVFILISLFCIFFDQAVLTRGGTVYRIKSQKNKIAITFDDGPSPIWTPQILDELKKANVKATFFMVGHHVQKYPDVAKRVAEEGHDIGNHGFAHSVVLYYTPAEIEEEIKYTEHVIRQVTGYTTKIFRPPKAWITWSLKEKIRSMGYETVLWSLNSKDWVAFDHKMMVRYLIRHVKGGDILLFHDSGNVLSHEGGDRSQTVKALPILISALRQKGYEIVSLEELMYGKK